MPVPSAIRALPSASLSAPVASCDGAGRQLGVAGREFRGPGSQGPGAAQQAGVGRIGRIALDAGVQGHGSVGQPRAALGHPGGGLEQARVLGVAGDPVHPDPDLGRSVGQKPGAQHHAGAAGILAVELPGQRRESGLQLARSCVQLARAVLQPLRAGLQLAGTGVELVRARGDLGDLVLHHRKRNEPLDRVIRRRLQQFQSLSQGRGPGSGLRIAVGTAVALELVRAACQRGGAAGQLGSAAVEPGGAVGEVVLCVARRRRRQRGGKLHGPGRELLRTVVHFVDAGGELVVDIGFDLDGTCRRAGRHLPGACRPRVPVWR